MIISENLDMKKYSSFKTGGRADKVLFPETENELVTALSEYKNAVVLGNISNTLITDKGIRNEVIMTSKLRGITVTGERIEAFAGESITVLAKTACEKSLTGLEFAYGIPGSVGGAVFMNAGAFGGEMSNALERVRVCDRNGNVFDISRDDMNFGYRKSIVKEKNYAVISAVFALKYGDKSKISETMADYMEKRTSRQPLEFPSAGSVFKRPEGFFAGALIEQAGLKGRRVGGVSVSEKHAGFIINDKNGTSDDVLGLISEIEKEVYEKFGVRLEKEIIVVGQL